MLVGFEGPDGAGKTTQLRLLAERLERMDKEFLSLKEPSYSELGMKARRYLNDPQGLSEEEIQRICSEDARYQEANVIQPAIKQGQIVLVDGYKYTGTIYGEAKGVEWSFLEALNNEMRDTDYTFVLMLPVTKCLERIKARGTELQPFETETILSRVVKNYIKMAEYKDNFYLIAANRPQLDIHREIVEILNIQASE